MTHVAVDIEINSNEMHMIRNNNLYIVKKQKKKKRKRKQPPTKKSKQIKKYHTRRGRRGYVISDGSKREEYESRHTVP